MLQFCAVAISLTVWGSATAATSAQGTQPQRDPDLQLMWSELRSPHLFTQVRGERKAQDSPPVAAAFLIERLVNSEEARDVHAARRGLVRCGHHAVSALEAQLHRPDIRGRQRALLVLGDLGQAAVSSIPAMLAIASDSDDVTNEIIGVAMGRIGQEGIDAILRAIVADEQGAKGGLLAAAAARPTIAGQVLAAYLSERADQLHYDELLRLEHFARSGGGGICAPLLPLLEHDIQSVRNATLQCLAAVDEPVHEAATRALSLYAQGVDLEDMLVAMVIQTLALDAVPLVLETLDQVEGGYGRIRLVALLPLVDPADDRVVETLERLAEDGDASERMTALGALRRREALLKGSFHRPAIYSR